MEEKKYLILMGLSCLNKKDEKDPKLKMVNSNKPIPTEDEVNKFRKGLETGNIEDDLLKKFIKTAYTGFENFGFFEYGFSRHNDKLSNMPNVGKLPEMSNWCKLIPGKVIGKTKKGYMVKDADGKIEELNVFSYGDIKTVKKDLSVGSLVAKHRGYIQMCLDKDQFNKAIKFYKA